ncbi:MAG: AAA family ATPase [Deltaproteobacteria bacterium]|nr:AAA family ATPase [Deltaproteobacteria bacterium]MBN2846036.1 AAA family ATPase [Deltaproteobacteria bacterium]
MTNLGTYKEKQGFEILLKEINSLLLVKDKVVIAIAGLPGIGKTHLVKNFIRFGFGNFHRRDVTVIDDNIIYTTKFWKLKWTKIKDDKKSINGMVNSIDTKIVFFSNWIPSRFIDFADIMIYLELNESERLRRLRKRYRKAPEKFLIQKEKTTIPVEPPFVFGKDITLINNSNASTRWSIVWTIRRFFSH